MSEVKRYDCTNGKAQHCYGCYQMDESAEGDYVSWADFDAQRLRADTAEDELRTERLRADAAVGDANEAERKLAAAEQRNAELVELLHAVSSPVVDGELLTLERSKARANARTYLAALNPNPDPVKETWLDMVDLPEHKIGAEYRMILDGVPQRCVEVEMSGRKRWFYGDENGPFPEDEIQAWLPINPNPEAESHEAFNDPLYNAESDARNAASLLEEVLERFDDGVGRSPEEFKLMRKIGSWLGRSVPNTGSDECAHSYANKIGCPECGELMQKPCACPGCERPRKRGTLFCSPHQHSDSRLNFIAQTPSPTNEQLAYMMQRDGEQQ